MRHTTNDCRCEAVGDQLSRYEAEGRSTAKIRDWGSHGTHGTGGQGGSRTAGRIEAIEVVTAVVGGDDDERMHVREDLRLRQR